MVLGGLRTKSRTVNADYLIYIQEIKPWPPIPSLKTLRSVLIQWENGDRNSGTTTPVVPSLGSSSGEGKIEFNEFFKLPVTFSMKNGGEVDTFQKNCLEFNLYEPRRDKTVKGQLLGTAIIDLADYGAVKDTLSLSVAVNCQRSFRNTAQPILYLKIQKVDKLRTRSVSMEILAMEASMAKNGVESVSALMSEEYAEEAEFASITDDDVSSSHSSLNVLTSNGCSPPQNGENSSDNTKDASSENIKDNTLHSKLRSEKSEKMSLGLLLKNSQGNMSCSSSIDLSSSPRSQVNGHVSLSDSTEPNIMATRKDIITPRVQSFSTDAADVNTEKSCTSSLNDESLVDIQISSFGDKRVSSKIEALSKLYSTGDVGTNNNSLTSDRLKHVKSVRSIIDSGKSNGFFGDGQDGLRFGSSERKDSNETKKDYQDNKVEQLEQRIKALEGELREVAGVEVAIYSVVSEHGSSMSKVHAPSRRLSRLYLHAFQENSLSRRANAARTSVSGLLVVSKACGNDVPRLTFWLSNAVLLRIIISKAIADEELPLSSGPSIEKTDIGKSISNSNRSSILKWQSSSILDESINGLCSNKEWEDPNTYISALEKVEAWIFSRIVESVWWQTLTPHMQSTAAKAIEESVGSNSSKSYKRVSSSCDEERINLSLDLWKKAFQDASERLCPVRAGGHECGCLHVITKLIMEQCVARLDVAMFNALLRESADEIPTDPVSDPISDSKVLPIPAGKFSFGAGAQLKNAIGNWSRLLSDLFGMDDDVPLEHKTDQNHEGEKQDPSFKPFHILNAFSDLMMLPKDMLLSRSIRKEVCPTFGGSLVKRIINSFVPDKFCPDPVPELVLEALNSEENLNLESDEFMTNFPCMAAPVVYSAPRMDSITHIIGEIKSPRLRRSGSSVLRKSYTSDDELDELDSPLTCIFTDTRSSSSTSSNSDIVSNQSSVRYQLLREVWMESL